MTKKYIIEEEELNDLFEKAEPFTFDADMREFKQIVDIVRSHPYSHQNKTSLENLYKQLKDSAHLIWQSPQSFGQRNVVDLSDVNSIFKKYMGEGL